MGAGDTSYFGFEYQLYASVFLMLIEHQNLSFSEMTVETTFGNDAAIQSVVVPSLDFDLEEREFSVHVNGGRVTKQIQVKTKARHYLWHSSEFREVLLKADESSTSKSKAQTVLDRLINNPEEIFIFFTDGVVHPDIASLRSDPVTLRRKQPDKPVSLAADSIINSTKNAAIKGQLQALKNSLVDRIFIVESLDIELLKTKICDVIYKTYNVPYHSCTEKMIGLVDLVRQRMLREGEKDRITKSELEKIIGSPSPQTPYADLIDKFVPTSEYARALETLAQKHIVIVCGEPCVGKTTIARAIVNAYFEKNYELKLLDNSDAHLHITAACISHETRIFLLDDGLGVINYESQFALADQLPQLVSQISSAKGRIKLVITTRRNVLAEAKNASRLGNINIEHYTIYVQTPTTVHLNSVFNKYLTNFSETDKQLIKATISIGQFENLVHLRHFIDEVMNISEKSSDVIIEVFASSRPSEYRRWTKSQPAANQLCLFILWMLIEANNFVIEDDLKRVYTLAEDCVNLPPVPAFGNRFADSLDDLIHNKNRVERLPNGTLNFIHPQLRNAIKDYLYTGNSGTYDFLKKLITHLVKIEHPLEQSIASLICLFFRKQLGSDIDQMLNNLLNSKYIQTIETIIRLNGLPFMISFLENASNPEEEDNTIKTIELLRRKFLYSPRDCELDEKGNLIRKKAIASNVIYGYEMADHITQSLEVRTGRVSEEKQAIFETVLKQNNIGILNPLERYQFAFWLYHHSSIVEPSELANFVRTLAIDPISFVRGASAIFLRQEVLMYSQEYQSSFQSLCYDGHPNVKREVLEHVILKNWQFMPEEIQEEWLQMVSDMLDDPVVRLYSSMGLINQSGSLYHYHEGHNLEQKRQWFIALAPKLISHGFTQQIYFDRFLTPLDEYFADLPIPFRTELLTSIADYIEKNHALSEDTLYSIEKVILQSNPTPQENEICLGLINNLTSWGRSRLCYSFAKNYRLLKDIRFRQFVHYPFYNEAEFQYIAERAAALLGFKANSSLKLDDLPPVLDRNKAESISNVINEYWRQQNDDFKLLSVMMAHGYGAAHHIGAVYDRCFEVDIISEIIESFSKSNNIDKVKVVVEVVLNKVYLWEMGLEDKPKETLMQSNWFKRLELFLYNQNPEIEKCVCELVFASNIASSVHNMKTFLFLIYLLLNHPNESTSSYASEFFDKFFYKIKDMMFDPDLPELWKKEIADTWFSREFQIKLLEKSVNYKEWWQSAQFFKTVASGWPTYSDEIRHSIILFMEMLVQQSPPEIIEILNWFHYEISESTSDQQREQIESLLGIQQAHQGIKLTEKHIRERKELNQFFAQVNWDLYFDS